MKRILVMSIGVLLVVAAAASAQTTPPAGTQPVAGKSFVDANANGVCDRFEAGTSGQGAQQGRRTGPRDGTGRQLRGAGRALGGGAGLGPASGAGPGSPKCDGTGPKGRGRGGR
jgi:hypothetical protein